MANFIGQKRFKSSNNQEEGQNLARIGSTPSSMKTGTAI